MNPPKIEVRIRRLTATNGTGLDARALQRLAIREVQARFTGSTSAAVVRARARSPSTARSGTRRGGRS